MSLPQNLNLFYNYFFNNNQMNKNYQRPKYITYNNNIQNPNYQYNNS